MSRLLDLDKVRQAWQLRREGKQQKEIAEELSLSLRHIQNYLSLDWMAQRSMRVLMRGGAEEVNDQLKTVWGLGPAATGENGRKVRGKAATAAVSDEATTLEPPVDCHAPEQWPDVARLEDWGVPKYAAPGLLGAWRRAHRDGTHELCVLWANLAENIQAKIPFADAYDLAMANWLADRWSFGSLKTITELYRLYRPWEGKVHRKVYLDEVRAAIGNGSGGEMEAGPLFEGLPRRFLYGLPRGDGRDWQASRRDDDDDD
tara:strand:+ start:101 stop:877 length:777 start_codon:yes stop_codon:yes gene_type:complete